LIMLGTASSVTIDSRLLIDATFLVIARRDGCVRVNDFVWGWLIDDRVRSGERRRIHWIVVDSRTCPPSRRALGPLSRVESHARPFAARGGSLDRMIRAHVSPSTHPPKPGVSRSASRFGVLPVPKPGDRAVSGI
jgi:hypothetical protein